MKLYQYQKEALYSAGLGVASACAIHVSVPALIAPLAISYVAMHAFRG